MVETAAVSKDLETLFVTEESQVKPATNASFPRLYGHTLCPYVEKVRLALAARNVQYQKCDVDLGKKTAWHIGINGGLVPVWETPDGTILTESKVLMEYAEEAYPTQGYSLLPADPVVRAKMRLGIALTEALGPVYFPIYLKKATNEEEVKPLKEKIQKIEDFIAANGNDTSPYAIGTENPTQLDIHIYVHLVRVAMMEGSAFHDSIFVHVKFNDYPRIQKLIAAIRARPEFKSTLASTKAQHAFLAKFAEKPANERVQLYLPCDNDEE